MFIDLLGWGTIVALWMHIKKRKERIPVIPVQNGILLPLSEVSCQFLRTQRVRGPGKTKKLSEIFGPRTSFIHRHG
jgi:hypothetical protein